MPTSALLASTTNVTWASVLMNGCMRKVRFQTSFSNSFLFSSTVAPSIAVTKTTQNQQLNASLSGYKRSERNLHTPNWGKSITSLKIILGPMSWPPLRMAISKPCIHIISLCYRVLENIPRNKLEKTGRLTFSKDQSTWMVMVSPAISLKPSKGSFEDDFFPFDCAVVSCGDISSAWLSLHCSAYRIFSDGWCLNKKGANTKSNTQRTDDYISSKNNLLIIVNQQFILSSIERQSIASIFVLQTESPKYHTHPWRINPHYKKKKNEQKQKQR